MSDVVVFMDVTSALVECTCCGGDVVLLTLPLLAGGGWEVRASHHLGERMARVMDGEGDETVRERIQRLVDEVLCCPADWD